MAYYVAAFAGNIPFVIFMFWHSERFGLTKREASVLGTLSFIDVLLLPSALQRRWLWGWYGVTLILLLTGGFWPLITQSLSFQLVKDQLFRNKRLDASPVNTDLSITEKQDTSQPYISELLPQMTVIEAGEIQENTGSKSLEEMIDLGFTAKNAGGFLLAAQWFGRALEMEPEPDLALSLLMDIFWLCQAAEDRGFAEKQIAFNIKKINFVNFPEGIGQQFNDWLERENLSTGHLITY